MTFNDYEVFKIERESKNISSFYLKPLNGIILPDYLPGQYITIKVRPKGQNKTISRNYTLSDKPGLDYYKISVKKEQKGLVSSFLHDEIKVGAILKVSAPAGNFYLSGHENTPVVMISGGVGITPLMSMLEYIAEHQPKRRVHFFHTSKNENLQPMGERLKKIAGNNININLFIHHTQPLEEEIQGVDYDYAGVIGPDHLMRHINEITQSSYYICGPISFMQDMSGHLTALGVANEQMHFEWFENPHKTHIENKSAEKTLNQGHQVHFIKSGLKTIWNMSHQNLLNLAESLGIEAANSCRMGTCATCETKIISGETIYDPEPFIEPSPGSIYICCAKPKTDIKLNL